MKARIPPKHRLTKEILDAPTREDYNALKLECESWHRLAVKYHGEMLQAQQLQEVWKSSAMKRGETDAEEPPEPQE